MERTIDYLFLAALNGGIFTLIFWRIAVVHQHPGVRLWRNSYLIFTIGVLTQLASYSSAAPHLLSRQSSLLLLNGLNVLGAYYLLHGILAFLKPSMDKSKPQFLRVSAIVSILILAGVLWPIGFPLVLSLMVVVTGSMFLRCGLLFYSGAKSIGRHLAGFGLVGSGLVAISALMVVVLPWLQLLLPYLSSIAALFAGVGLLLSFFEYLNENLQLLHGLQVENEKALKNSKGRIEKIHQVALEIARCQQINRIAELTVGAAEEILNFDYCNLAIIDQSGVHVVASTSDSPDDQLPLKRDLIGRTIRAQQSLIMEAASAGSGSQEALTIPIGQRGVLQAISKDARVFTVDDVKLAELLVSHTLAALQRLDYTAQLESKRAALAEKAKFETLVADISADFVTATINTIGEKIETTLARCGHFTQADRAFFLQLSVDERKLVAKHQWCRPQEEPRLERVEDFYLDQLLWFTRELRENKAIQIPAICNLPPGAKPEQQFFRRQRIQSLLCLPVIGSRQLLGYLCFASATESRTWTKDRLSVLSVITNVLADALMKNRIEQELEETNQALARLSITDSLTDLYNRRKIDQLLNDEVTRADRNHNSFAVILLDIDDFKKVNDTYGHQAGDLVLQELAEILTKNVRRVDTVGRWGGEEVLIIAPDTALEGGLALAEKLRVAISQYKFSEVGEVTCSFGVASYLPGDSVSSIVSRADKGLYLAKGCGRNRVGSATLAIPLQK